MAETLALGRRLGAALRAGSVVALVGTLGSGKTHLVKGLAAGCGVPDDRPVTSPTFVLVNEYRGRLVIQHIDAYRLGSGAELEALGFAEMVESGAAVVVEWADRVPECLPADCLRIEIEIIGPEERRFALSAGGPAAQDLLAALDET